MSSSQLYVEKELFRKLLPLLQHHFNKFREKHGNDNREGFMMELKRLQLLDETEMKRITDIYLLPDAPCLIWLIEWWLTFAARKLYADYGDDYLHDFPYVLIHPYLFIGKLFQCIANQWAGRIASSSSDPTASGYMMKAMEMDAFLRQCLMEQLERHIPISPRTSLRGGGTWRADMERLHKKIWNGSPELRPYISYHDKWFSPMPVGPSSSSSVAELLRPELKQLNRLLSALNTRLSPALPRLDPLLSAAQGPAPALAPPPPATVSLPLPRPPAGPQGPLQDPPAPPQPALPALRDPAVSRGGGGGSRKAKQREAEYEDEHEPSASSSDDDEPVVEEKKSISMKMSSKSSNSAKAKEAEVDDDDDDQDYREDDDDSD